MEHTIEPEKPQEGQTHHNGQAIQINTQELLSQTHNQEEINLPKRDEVKQTSQEEQRGDEKKNEIEFLDGLNETQDSNFQEFAARFGKEVSGSLQTDRQDSNLQKQASKERPQIIKLGMIPFPSKVPPKGPKKFDPPLLCQTEDNQYYCYIGEDDQDDYQDDQDEMIQISDESDSSIDSDDQQPSDDSYPEDYDEAISLQEILKLYKRGQEFSIEQYVESYENERKKIEEQDKRLKNFQTAYGVNTPFEIQLEKQALNQNSIDFFNKHYLIYLELNGGKKRQTLQPPATSQKSVEQRKENSEDKSQQPEKMVQSQSLQTIIKQIMPKTQKEINKSSKFNSRIKFKEELEESQESQSTIPKRKRVMFNDQISFKVFKEDEEVTVMKDTQEAIEDLNNLEKLPTLKRIMPMTLQFLRKSKILPNNKVQSCQLSLTSPKDNNKDNIFVICQKKKQTTNQSEKNQCGSQKDEEVNQEKKISIGSYAKTDEQDSTFSESDENTLFEPQRKKSFAEIFIGDDPSPGCSQESKVDERIKDSIIT